jgi:hypothetical protein
MIITNLDNYSCMTSPVVFLSGLGGLLAAVGVVGLLALVPDDPDAPSTTGRVTEIGIADVTSDTFDERADNKQFAPEISYSYEVDGERYQGQGLHWEGTVSYGAPAQVKSALEPYLEDDDVTVYYRADDPSQSCLEGESSIFGRTEFLFALVVGVVLLLGAGGLFVMG